MCERLDTIALYKFDCQYIGIWSCDLHRYKNNAANPSQIQQQSISSELWSLGRRRGDSYIWGSVGLRRRDRGVYICAVASDCWINQFTGAYASQRRSSLYWVICFNSTAHGTDQKWHAQWPSHLCKTQIRSLRARRPVKFLDAPWIYYHDDKYVRVYTFGRDIFQLSHPPFGCGDTFIYIPNCGTRSGNINVLCIRAKCPRRLFCLDHTRTGLYLDMSESKRGKMQCMRMWHHADRRV